MNPHLFIVGSPRSGTTLLKRMVDAHPEIAVTRETHWIPGYYRHRTGLTPDGYVSETLISKLLEHKRFSHLHLDPDEVSGLKRPGEKLHYSDFVSRIFDLYGKQENKALVADKTPPYVRHIDVLHELWPQARFIHVIRDGRDVCLSMLKWRMAHRAAGRRATWNEDPVTTTALWWEWLVRLGREAGERLPKDLYLEMRYEEFVDDPKAQMKTLCAFLDLPYDENTIRFHEGRTSSDSSLSANGAWLPPTVGLRDWRTQMPREDLELFESSAGELLDELGFERAVSSIPRAAREHASRMRSLFDGKPLPQRW